MSIPNPDRRKLISLPEHERQVAERMQIQRLMLSGIECPQCSHELKFKEHRGLMMSNPPQADLECTNEKCKFTTRTVV